MSRYIDKLFKNVSFRTAEMLGESELPAIATHHRHMHRSNFDNEFNNDLYVSGEVELTAEQELAIEAAPFGNQNGDFRFIDLFAGIGGFRQALDRQGGVCVFSSEWDRAAKETYFRNYGEVPFGDIRKFTNDNVEDELLNQLIPDHEVLAGGFPCQPFSLAGVSARNSLQKEHGFLCDTQGTLFYDIVRIASVKRPPVLFLENVRNLVSHDKGKTFKIIQDSLEELGYQLRYEIINAQSLVPQSRVRCYMVAIRNDLPAFEFDLTLFDGGSLPLRAILEEDESIYSQYQISERLWKGHQERTQRNLARGTGFTALLTDIDQPAKTLVARYYKDGKECLIPMGEGQPPRTLTRREAARLQGYPEEFVVPENKTPAFKQFGNSVALPVVAEIASQIRNYMDENNVIA